MNKKLISENNPKHKGTGTLCTRLKKRSFVHFFAEIFGGNGKNTYICTMKLKFNDIYGTQSKTNTSANGHFDFYEYEACDLNKTFQITKKLDTERR